MTTKIGLLVLLACMAGTARLGREALAADTYANPIDVLLADPFIHREGKTYYLYGTAASDGLLVWTSDDLVNWRLRGHAFKRLKSTWAQRDFWAPEMFVHRGKYYLHFTSRSEGDQSRRLVLAEGSSPLGPFREIKAPWFDPKRRVIDSHVFKDDDGQLYLYSVYLDTPAIRHFEVRVAKLDDQLNPAKDSTICIEPSEQWENGWVNEGPFVMKHNGTYFMTYSANGFESPNYSVGIATAKSPMGPWTKRHDGPILKRIDGVSGPGHHCFLDSPDGKELFIAYHTHQFLTKPGGPRQLCIDRARFVDGPQPTIQVDGPTITPQAMPSWAAPLVRGRNDEFDGTELDRKKWTIFSEDPNHWKLAGGKLTIETDDGDVFEDRSDLSNLFLTYAPDGDFSVTTKCTIRPEKDFEHAFVTIWQDHNNYVKLAYVHSHGDRKFEVGVEIREDYSSQLFDSGQKDEVWLRIEKKGDVYAFDASEDGKTWKRLAEREAKLIDLRAGIGACSPLSARPIPAAFDHLRFSKN